MPSLPTQGGPLLMEAGAHPAAFDAIDTNHDGVITREEFAAAVQANSTMTYAEPVATEPIAPQPGMARVPTQEGMKAVYAVPPTTTTYTSGSVMNNMPMQTMTVQTTIGIMPTAMPQTISYGTPQTISYGVPQYIAQPVTPPMSQATYVTTAPPTQNVVQGSSAGTGQIMNEAFKVFDMFDKDGDGAITQDEFKEAVRTKIFDMFDQNKNGVITRDELENAMANAEGSGNFMQTMLGLLSKMEGSGGANKGLDGQHAGGGEQGSFAERLVQLECSESLFADELAQLPGGEDALRFLLAASVPGWEAKQDQMGHKCVENVSTGERIWEKPLYTAEHRREALDQISKSMQAAKERALAQARELKAQAAQAERAASDATDFAMKAVVEDQSLEVEHQILAEIAQRHKDAEAKADQDSQRLAALAQQAMQEAQTLQDEYLHAQNHHQDALGHHQDISGRHAHARGAVGRGLPPAHAQQVTKAQQQQVQQQYISAAKRMQAAKTASEAAAQKMQRLMQEMNQLEECSKPGAGNPLVQLSHHQAQATLKQKEAIRLRNKAEDLKRQADELQQQAEYALQVAAHAEKDAEQYIQFAADETDKVRSSYPGGILPETGIPVVLSPEETAKKLQQLRAQVAQANAQAQHQAALAQQEDANVQAAHQALEQVENDLEAHDAADQLHEEEALAKLMADQAHAKAQAAQQAAAAAARHAAICHQRSEEGRKKLEEQQVHAQNAHANERQAWAKRFGDGNVPRGAADENEGQAEAQRAAQMSKEAQAIQQDSRKAEIEAYKLEMLIQAIEQAKQECGPPKDQDLLFSSTMVNQPGQVFRGISAAVTTPLTVVSPVTSHRGMPTTVTSGAAQRAASPVAIPTTAAVARGMPTTITSGAVHRVASPVAIPSTAPVAIPASYQQTASTVSPYQRTASPMITSYTGRR